MPPLTGVTNGSRNDWTKSGKSQYNAAREDPQAQSLLLKYDDDEVHDLICVGFGPASLAIAVALQDALEAHDPSLRTSTPKVRFLERQPHFSWHAGMLLPDAKMQITFIKDLATLRNPRSEFTFLNYLHRKGRLASFTNLGTFLPQRIEYEDYMRWCAVHFENVVDYSQDVECVAVGGKNPHSNSVAFFQVQSRHPETGKVSFLNAKNVVLAVGGKPNIPEGLDASHPRVIHSSSYATGTPKMFSSMAEPQSIAVVGAGQSAAEIFHNIPSRFPLSKSYLLIRGSALRPSDDSPFVNEIFDPDRVDDVYSQARDVRANSIAQDKSTNYGVVRLELLEEIYARLYSNRIQHAYEKDWPQQILTHRTVTGMTDGPSGSGGKVRLYIDNRCGEHKVDSCSNTETLDVDLVIVASGYKRNAHEQILKPLEHLKSDTSLSWEVNRDYSIRFQDRVVHSDASIWLQGANESTHGLSDTLLSILAIRGGEMVQSVFGLIDAASENSDWR